MWREHFGKLTAPFDGYNAFAGEVVVKAELSEFRVGSQAVEVHVNEWQPAAVVFVDKRESGTGDIARIATEGFCESLDEAGFARTHGALQTQCGSASKAGCEIVRCAASRLLVGAKAFPARKGIFDLRVCHEGGNLVRSFG